MSQAAEAFVYQTSAICCTRAGSIGSGDVMITIDSNVSVGIINTAR